MQRLTLAQAFLRDSPYRYDPTAWLTMLEAFAGVPELDEHEAFHAAARAMNYKRYIRTLYWGIIRGWMTSQTPRCAQCGNPGRLQIHHKTYDHRGSEHLNLQDLEVICSLCHKSEHDLTSPEEEKKIDARIRWFKHGPGRPILSDEREMSDCSILSRAIREDRASEVERRRKETKDALAMVARYADRRKISEDFGKLEIERIQNRLIKEFEKETHCTSKK